MASQKYGFGFKSINEVERSVIVTASTEALDSHGTVLEQDWDLSRFIRNPVVLWNHDSSQMPIGLAHDVAVGEEGLTMRIAFASLQANPEAERIWTAVKEGLVRGVSVRFASKQVREEERDGQKVSVLSGNELLEVSLTPLPSNPETLVQSDEPAAEASARTGYEPDEDDEGRKARASEAGRILAKSKPKKAPEAKTDAQDDVIRLDAGTFGKVEYTPQGGIRVPARLTRTGVLNYLMPDGTKRRELRLPEEVFAPASIATLRGAPVTDRHPPGGSVLSDTWKQDAVGHVEGPRADGDKYVEADVVIQDAKAVDLVERGERREVSAGYRCRLDFDPGVWNGQAYDAIQRDIKYNHVAIGPRGWGRAGPEVGLRLDGSEARYAFDTDAVIEMKTIRLDGKDYEIGSDQHFAKLDEMHKAELATKDKEHEGLKAKCDSLESDLKKVKADLATATDPKKLEEKVSQRADFLSRVRAVLGEQTKTDGKTDRELMVDCIKSDAKDFEDKDRSDEYIRARFDLLADRGVRADGIDSVVKTAELVRRTDSVSEAEKAEKAMLERHANAWKKTSTQTAS